MTSSVPRPARRGAALLAVAALSLSACGVLGDDDSAEFDNGETPSEKGGEGEGGEQTGQASGPAEDVTLSLEDAVETITYPMQDVDGEITMGLHTPRVLGEAMLVQVTFLPEYDDEDGEDVLQFRQFHGPEGHSVLLPVVSDRQNLKAYHVPRVTTNMFQQGGGWGYGSYEAWASAIGDVAVRSGEEVTHWAYFPVPEDDVDTVDIAVVPGAPEFADVQIDWGGGSPVQHGDGGYDEEELPEDPEGAGDE